MTADTTATDATDANTPAQGEIVTFYSYKGGTGRTMALANIACLLAKRGQGRVLMIDWDLEAPGLHHYFAGKLTGAFGPAPADQKALVNARGLVELSVELGRLALAATAPDTGRPTHSNDAGAPTDPADAADTLVSGLNLAPFVIQTDVPMLDLIKAGRFDARYAAKLSRLKWETWFRRCPELFPALARRLASVYRWVLIDARTGSTDTTGICTMQMPDKLVVVFTPNKQSLVGITGLTRRAVAWRARYGDARPLTVYPLPSRIDSERESLRQQWREGHAEGGIEGYQPLFESALREAYGLQACTLQAYFNEVQVQHSPDYAFGERIAVNEAATTSDDRFSVARSYEALLGWLADGIPPWESRERWQSMVELMQLEDSIATLEGASTADPQLRRERSAMMLARVQLAARVHGGDSMSALEARETLASDYAARGMRDEALALQQQAVTEVRAVADARLVRALRGLGALHQTFGALDAAEASLREALAVADKAPDVGQIESIVTASDLGSVLRVQGKLTESRRLLEDAHRGLVANVGATDPRTLAAQSRLAEVLWAQGELDTAQNLVASGLEVQRRTRGATHDDTLASTTVMANMLMIRGNYVAGGELLQGMVGALAKRDPTGTQTDAVRTRLAVALQYQGRDVEAQTMLEEVLTRQRATLGEAHPNTIESMMALGSVLGLAGKWSAARSLQEQALALIERVFGPGHLRTLQLVAELANTLEQLGELAGAEQLVRRLLDQSMGFFGPSDVSTADVMNRLAQVLIKSKRANEARELVERAIDAAAASDDNAKTEFTSLRPALHLTAAMACAGGNDFEQALAHFRIAVHLFESTLGPSDEKTLRAKRYSALMLAELGRNDEAIMQLETVRSAAASTGHDDVGLDEALAQAYARTGRHADAMALLSDGLPALLGQFGEGSNEAVSRFELLATLAKEAGDTSAESRWKDAVIGALKASRESRSPAR